MEFAFYWPFEYHGNIGRNMEFSLMKVKVREMGRAAAEKLEIFSGVINAVTVILYIHRLW